MQSLVIGVVGGVSLSSNQSEIEYIGENNFELNLNSNLTGLNPYFGWTSQNSETQIHLNTGFGTGQIAVSQKRWLK